ncbi:PBSP domain protein [Aspergillus ambiguus]|uniref:basic secretory family protein n=1 Tax=Aspergillus ambiguus TaxID=176160 RepID=UPI003CCD3051
MTKSSYPTPSAVPKPHPSTDATNADPPDPNIPKPALRLHQQDLRHPGTKAFSQLVPDVVTVLETALGYILANLYTPPPASSHHTFTPTIPATDVVTLVLREFDGVAYTTGGAHDKEIDLSLSYVVHSTQYADPAAELRGILTHELVHCYQHTAPPCPEKCDYPPGGLIEGIADFVRLKAGLAPPHWTRPQSAKDRPEKWDQGYQHTAYFLEWLEDARVGRGAVGMLNDRLLRVGYREGFWEALAGVDVQRLWEEYGLYLDTVRDHQCP